MNFSFGGDGKIDFGDTDFETFIKNINKSLPLNNKSETDFFCDLPQSYYNKIWAHQVHIYVLYVITIVGSISNLIAFTVLIGSPRMRKSPCGIFLISLAVADTSVLTGELLGKLAGKHTGMPPLDEISDIGCGILWYFRFLSKAVASYIVVCISVNRLLVVSNPLKSKIYSNVKLVLLQILAVIVIMAILCFYIPFLIINEGCGCDVDSNYHWQYFLATVVIDIGIIDILASVIILASSLWTICIIVSSKGSIQRHMPNRNNRNRNTEQIQLTTLLLVVSLTFFFLRLPGLVTWTMTVLSDAFDITPELVNARFLCYSLSLVNYGINLYLYSLCSGSFRADFRRLCCACRRKRKEKLGSDRKSRFPSTSRSSISLRNSVFSTGNITSTSV